ncbi:MAG: phage head-tail connector protein [Pararhodobacter sp.]|nr:phage head-tail connector protein [Pararhodobacter sp.]
MAIVTEAELIAQLGLEGITGHEAMLAQKIAAAQAHVERLLGFKIEAQFGGEDQEPIPEPLREAVLQLAAWWFEQREAGLTGTIVTTPPHSLPDIVAEYREWTF